MNLVSINKIPLSHLTSIRTDGGVGQRIKPKAILRECRSILADKTAGSSKEGGTPPTPTKERNPRGSGASQSSTPTSLQGRVLYRRPPRDLTFVMTAFEHTPRRPDSILAQFTSSCFPSAASGLRKAVDVVLRPTCFYHRMTHLVVREAWTLLISGSWYSGIADGARVDALRA